MEYLQSLILVADDPLATAVNVIIIVIGIEAVASFFHALAGFYK